MAPSKHIDFQQILHTAISLADQNGFEAVTLASVAAQLGIRIPSLYNHISGLPGLRYEMTLWTFNQACDLMRRAAVGKSGDEAIISISDTLRAFALAHPGIYPLTQRAMIGYQAELVAAQEEILGIFVAALRPYGFANDDALHAVRAFRSVVHGFIVLEISGGFGMDLNRDESFRLLIQMLIAGLQASRSAEKISS